MFALFVHAQQNRRKCLRIEEQYVELRILTFWIVGPNSTTQHFEC